MRTPEFAFTRENSGGAKRTDMIPFVAATLIPRYWPRLYKQCTVHKHGDYLKVKRFSC